MKSKIRISIIFVTFFMGLLLALQVKIMHYNEAPFPYSRAQELTKELSRLEEECTLLRAETRDLEEKLQQARKGYEHAESALLSELEKAKSLAGLKPVTGPGVRVVLQNVLARERDEYTSLFSVRDEDLLKIVNELRASGAEAISINGQRLMPASEIRLAGSFINVNLVRILPPFEILAFGNPDTLESALLIDGGLVDYLQDWGIQVTVEKLEELTVPAYSGNLELKYATSVKEGE